MCGVTHQASTDAAVEAPTRLSSKPHAGRPPATQVEQVASFAAAGFRTFSSGSSPFCWLNGGALLITHMFDHQWV